MPRYWSPEREELIRDFKTVAVCAIPSLAIIAVDTTASYVEDSAVVPYNYVMTREVAGGNRVFSGLEVACSDGHTDNIARVAVPHADVVLVDTNSGVEWGASLSPAVFEFDGMTCVQAVREVRTGSTVAESPLVAYVMNQITDDSYSLEGTKDAGEVIRNQISLAYDNGQVGRI